MCSEWETIYLPNNSQSRIANLENMLIEPSEPVRLCHRIRLDEGIRKSITSSKHDFVHIRDFDAIFEFDCTIVFQRKSFDRFLDADIA